MMIFAGECNGKKHIDMVLSGEKTQTRRLSSRYLVGRTYAIQPCRTCKGTKGKKIMIDDAWVEQNIPNTLAISWEDALAEGGYTQREYEELFRKMYGTWWARYAYKFHLVESKNPQKTQRW